MGGWGVAGGRRRHVAQHEIGRSAQRGADLTGGGKVAEITGQQRSARHGGGLLQVDPDQRAMAFAGADPGGGDLGPAARRATEIDDPYARPQQMVALVELDQLEGGARVVPEAVRLGDIGIVQLTVEPFGRGRLAPPRRPDPDGKRPGAIAAPGASSPALAHPYSGPSCISSNR